MDYLTRIEQLEQQKKIPADTLQTFRDFYHEYVGAAASNGYVKAQVDGILLQFVELVLEQLQHPFHFEAYHERITAPVNLYEFGIEFIRPLVIKKGSQVMHSDRASQIEQQLAQGDNVIFLANHQTELDPQAISLLLQNTHPQIAENLIAVAGHRVVTDPLAVPFSKGRNLLCVYSKRHIENDPSLKTERQQHNQRTMKQMSDLLSEGGKCIYVAPSGGRDRRNSEGEIEIAPYDPQSLEMFWLMAQKAERKTHFYPLALATYYLLPPPDTIDKALGEVRTTTATPISLSIGAEVDMDNFPGSEKAQDKKVKRKLRADYIWQQVNDDYRQLLQTASHSD